MACIVSRASGSQPTTSLTFGPEHHLFELFLSGEVWQLRVRFESLQGSQFSRGEHFVLEWCLIVKAPDGFAAFALGGEARQGVLGVVEEVVGEAVDEVVESRSGCHVLSVRIGSAAGRTHNARGRIIPGQPRSGA